jgi:hypothetical protein
VRPWAPRFLADRRPPARATFSERPSHPVKQPHILDFKRSRNGLGQWVGAWDLNTQCGNAPCPYGKPGDLLWVRETWCRVDDRQHGGSVWVDFRATPRYSAERPAGWENEPEGPDALNWKPSIHMPRWASRLTLELTEVRVQRLQDISDADARAEGLSILTKDDGRTWKYGIPDRDGLPGNDDDGWHWADWNADPRVAYARLWESLHGPGSWLANPWVWVVSFAVHRQNVDELLTQRSAA